MTTEPPAVNRKTDRHGAAMAVNRRDVALGLSALLVTGGPVASQSSTAQAAQWVAALRQHFQAARAPEEALAAAQGLMVAAGYMSDLPDGRWGPRTEAGFLRVTGTMIEIGFEEPDLTDPAAVAELVIGWLLGVVRALTLGTDFPD